MAVSGKRQKRGCCQWGPRREPDLQKKGMRSPLAIRGFITSPNPLGAPAHSECFAGRGTDFKRFTHSGHCGLLAGPEKPLSEGKPPCPEHHPIPDPRAGDRALCIALHSCTSACRASGPGMQAQLEKDSVLRKPRHDSCEGNNRRASSPTSHVPPHMSWISEASLPRTSCERSL